MNPSMPEPEDDGKNNKDEEPLEDVIFIDSEPDTTVRPMRCNCVLCFLKDR